VRQVRLLRAFGFRIFEQGIDRHGVAAAKIEIVLKSSADLARLHVRLELAVLDEALLGGELLEFGSALVVASM
jgi:hypothetical protein